MSLVKAKIKFLIGARKGQTIPVRFNPNEYSIVRNMNYSEVAIPGLRTPIIQFVRGETQTLSLELYLDASDRIAPKDVNDATSGGGTAGAASASVQKPRGVEVDLRDLRDLVVIDSGLHAPPVIAFAWGELEFTGVVASYTEKFQLFHEEGYALRARVTLTIKSYAAPAIQARELKLESPDRTKTRVVAEGERIDAIALEEYGDAAQWPTIARANALARPRILVPGTVLVIPPL